MKILAIAVPAPLRTVLDYLPPEGPEPASGYQPGMRVIVPFGRRTLVGVLLEVRTRTDIDATRIRHAISLPDSGPFLPPDLLKLGRWASDYYQHPIGEVFSQMLPVAARRTHLKAHRVPAWRITHAGRSLDLTTLARRPAQRRALELLRAQPEGLTFAMLEDDGVRRPALKALQQAALVEPFEIETGTAPPHNAPAAAASDDTLKTEPHVLNDAQRSAAHAIEKALGGFRVLLLDGVTGSGKTEVYFHAMRRALDAGHQVLFLVPEISLTPQTIARVTSRFAEPHVVLHSALTDRARLDAWRAAAEGNARIVLGTRSAVFAPLPDAGLIIIDEEHDESYRQQDGFRHSARDLAVVRARDLAIPVVLGSATPSLDSLHNAANGRYEHLVLPERAGTARPPSQRPIEPPPTASTDAVGPTLLAAMTDTLARGEQVLVFIDRRGFAPVLHCPSCRWIAECGRCDARMTLHARPERLQCHHCGSTRRPPPRCPECGAPEPLPVGRGTQRLEAELAGRFPQHPVLRIDRDQVRSARILESAMQRIHSGDPAILVGTRMLAKGHHFPRVTLVAILDADGGLFSADFRASERLAQLLVQVSGRAGRGDLRGEVLIQTRHPEHPLLTTLLRQGYAAFARAALEERQAAGLPPYSHLALLRAESHQRQDAHDFLKAAAGLLRKGGARVDVLGPVPALMERRGGRFRAQLMLRADSRRPLHALLADGLPQIDVLPAARKVRWSLDVDPLDTY